MRFAIAVLVTAAGSALALPVVSNKHQAASPDVLKARAQDLSEVAQLDARAGAEQQEEKRATKKTGSKKTGSKKPAPKKEDTKKPGGVDQICTTDANGTVICATGNPTLSRSVVDEKRGVPDVEEGCHVTEGGTLVCLKSRDGSSSTVDARAAVDADTAEEKRGYPDVDMEDCHTEGGTLVCR